MRKYMMASFLFILGRCSGLDSVICLSLAANVSIRARGGRPRKLPKLTREPQHAEGRLQKRKTNKEKEK